MRKILSEKNLVVLLFIMVVVTFSFAQEDTKKMNSLYSDVVYMSRGSLIGAVSPQRVKSSRYSSISSLPSPSTDEVRK